MNEIIDIRANIYTQDVNTQTLTTEPFIELVIIHSDGKNYEIRDDKLVSIPLLSDTRFVLSPKEFDRMILDMQDWQKTLNNRVEFWNDILPGKPEETK
jgi:hypothetical protein